MQPEKTIILLQLHGIPLCSQKVICTRCQPRNVTHGFAWIIKSAQRYRQSYRSSKLMTTVSKKWLDLKPWGDKRPLVLPTKNRWPIVTGTIQDDSNVPQPSQLKSFMALSLVSLMQRHLCALLPGWGCHPAGLVAALVPGIKRSEFQNEFERVRISDDEQWDEV